MFKGILVLLLVLTLPNFAFNHAVGNSGYDGLYVIIMSTIGYFISIMITALALDKRYKHLVRIFLISCLLILGARLV